MRLTPEELKKHNDKVLKIAELRCAKSDIPGLTVSYPDYMKGDSSKVQLALPCGIDRSKKRKVNAMQVRTGAFTTSLAKEKTKYDSEIGEEYNDSEDYTPFDFSVVSADGGELITQDNSLEISAKDATPKFKMYTEAQHKGILDL